MSVFVIFNIMMVMKHIRTQSRTNLLTQIIFLVNTLQNSGQNLHHVASHVQTANYDSCPLIYVGGNTEESNLKHVVNVSALKPKAMILNVIHTMSTFSFSY